MKNVKRMILGLVAAATLTSGLLVARPAQAALIIGTAGYVCRVEYDPTTGGSGGNFGTVKVHLYSGGACSGSEIGLFSMYSTNSTAAGPKFREQALFHNLTIMRDAMVNWTKVNFRYESSNRAVGTVILFPN